MGEGSAAAGEGWEGELVAVLVAVLVVVVDRIWLERLARIAWNGECWNIEMFT
jgi:hypothetical protein